MKLLQNSWSELLMLNILYLQTCHDRCDVLLVVSNHTDLHPGCFCSKNSSSLFFILQCFVVVGRASGRVSGLLEC